MLVCKVGFFVKLDFTSPVVSHEEQILDRDLAWLVDS